MNVRRYVEGTCGLAAVFASLAFMPAVADEFVWQGTTNNVLSLTSPSSYKVDGATATRLPGADDFVTIDNNTYAEVDNDTINFINSVGYFWLRWGCRLVFNVTTNASVTVPLSAMNVSSGAASAYGTIEKNCGSELSLTSISSSFLYGSNKQHVDYYCACIKVNSGAVRIQETGDASRKSEYFMLGELAVADGAAVFLPQPGNSYIWGLSGDGLVTNDCAIAGATIIRIQSGPATFGGMLASRAKLSSLQVVGNQKFTSTASTINSAVFHLDSPKGGVGYAGLASFGANESSLSSLGTFGSLQLRSQCTNHLEYIGLGGETVSKQIYIYGGLGYPQIIDAGAHGGETFTGTWYGGTAVASFGGINLIITGSNTQEFVLNQNLKDSILNGTGSAGHQWEGQLRPLSVTKRGTGTWYMGNNNRTFSGIVAVEEGTLAFATIKDRGLTCSLGVATNCYESKTSDSHEPFAKPDYADGNPVGYAIRLGAPGDLTKTGTLEYRGSAAVDCSTRPIAVTGGGRLLSTGGSLKFSGVFPYNAGENTLTLDGERTDNVLNDVTNCVGNLSIVKKGSGTWKLLGEQTFSGDVAVEEGVLQIGVCYTWFTINYRQNNTNATSWSSWKKHVRMKEFGLFDKDGARCNANLEYTAKTSNLSTLTLEPGQTEYRQAPGAYHAGGTYDNCGPDKLFDCSTSTYQYTAGNKNMDDETNPSTWIRVAMRLPEGVGDVTSFDMIPPSYSGNNAVYAPISWSVEGSVDGSTWVTLYETNGLTASDYTDNKWFYDGSSFSASGTHTGFPIKTATDGMTIAPAVRSVRVNAGATLNICGADVTVSRLVVDVAGMGTVKGIKLASAGTVDLVGDFTDTAFTVPADLSGLEGFGSLVGGGWTFTHNGGSMGSYGVRATATGFTVTKKGMAFIVR